MKKILIVLIIFILLNSLFGTDTTTKPNKLLIIEIVASILTLIFMAIWFFGKFYKSDDKILKKEKSTIEKIMGVILKKITKIIKGLFFGGVLYLCFKNWFTMPKKELLEHITALGVAIIFTVLITIISRYIISIGMRPKDIISNLKK